MNLEQQAVKSVFWVGIAKTAGQVLSWAVTFLLIRILSPDDYGLMGYGVGLQIFCGNLF